MTAEFIKAVDRLATEQKAGDDHYEALGKKAGATWALTAKYSELAVVAENLPDCSEEGDGSFHDAVFNIMEGVFTKTQPDFTIPGSCRRSWYAGFQEAVHLFYLGFYRELEQRRIKQGAEA